MSFALKCKIIEEEEDDDDDDDEEVKSQYINI